MSTVSMLEVYEPGELTVVGFGGHEVLDHLDLAEVRDELMKLIKEHGCKTLAVDLTGVKLLPSGLLGVLASIRGVGVEVQVFNACDDIREVLEITQLDRMLEVCEVTV